MDIDKEDFSALHFSKKSHTLYLVGSYGVEDRLYEFPLTNEDLKKINIPTSVVEKVIVMPSSNLYIQFLHLQLSAFVH